MGELATIKIDLLPDGRVRISSVCMDRPDSSYAPLAEERAPAEVEKLLGELRQRLKGVRPPLPGYCSCAVGPIAYRFVEDDRDRLLCGASFAACVPQCLAPAEASPVRFRESSVAADASEVESSVALTPRCSA